MCLGPHDLLKKAKQIPISKHSAALPAAKHGCQAECSVSPGARLYSKGLPGGRRGDVEDGICHRLLSAI